MNALTIPLGGLSAATTRLTNAAETIVHTATPPGSGGPASPAPSMSDPPLLAATGAPPGQATLARAAVDMKTAQHAYEANIAAFKVIDETQDSLLEMTL